MKRLIALMGAGVMLLPIPQGCRKTVLLHGGGSSGSSSTGDTTHLTTGTQITLTDSADVIIYGGTSAGIVAAIEAAELSKSVILIAPDKRIGGMTTNGLGATDVGNSSVIGGLAAEFYKKVGEEYGKNGAEYDFEPHVALKVFSNWIGQYPKIRVVYGDRLNLTKAAAKRNARITAVYLESGAVIGGKEFIDASYEGDLLKAAGVSYTYGREASDIYNESLNGFYSNGDIPGKISPYIVEGDPTSGLLPRVNSLNIALYANQATPTVQSYNFRLALSTDPGNTTMIQKPENYDEKDYLLLYRLLRKKTIDPMFIFLNVGIGNNKYDCNNGGPSQYLSTDYIGGNFEYTEGNYEIRDSIYNIHKTYTEGLFWTLQNSDSIPSNIRNFYKKYGLAKDEFTENNNWPLELYVREARRMVSDYVITQQTLLGNEQINDPIAKGSYGIDSHIVQYYVGADGYLSSEGCLGKDLPKPYKISYRTIVPKESECVNLLVPVCLSASHVAYASIRMEPQYMMLGQAAGVGAVIAINDSVNVQDVDYSELKKQLLTEGANLE